MIHLKRWYEEYPERFTLELTNLERFGYQYKIDPTEQNSGKIKLVLKKEFAGTSYEFEVIYPDAYPYFVCSVFCKSFPDGRHKNFYTGQLCTLRNPFTAWQVENTLAEHLNEQIPLILEAHRLPDSSEAIEANEAAQVTGQLPYLDGAVVLIDDFIIPSDIDCGTLIIGLQNQFNPQLPLRGCVIKIQDKSGVTIACANKTLSDRFSYKTLQARWARLPAPPKNVFDESVLSEATQLFPSLGALKPHDGVDIVGLLFPEETQYKVTQENWIFVIRIPSNVRQGSQTQGYLTRSDRADIKTMQARVPNLVPLATKKILVVGLGSVGSMCAWQLARAGIGGLTLIDFDHLQLGNIPRWMLGISVAGQLKTQLLGQFLANEYPYLALNAINLRIGDAMNVESPVLTQALSDVDLILDATAEWCISHYLSSLAIKNNIPYLWATGTSGGQGGTIGRVIPKLTGCWKCYQQFMYDTTFSTPPSANLPEVQPVGCFHPTFTGTGFDMDHVSIEVTRLVTATLCKQHGGGYPDFDWDVGILSLWDQDKPIAPKWETHQLKYHPECDCK